VVYNFNMQITPYAKNAKKHPAKQIQQLADIVREVGWRQPILVNQEGVIVAGHGRWETYQQNQDLAEPWVIDDAGKTIMGEPASTPLTTEQEMAYRLADNKLAETDVDMGLVIEELKELNEIGDMARLTGYDEELIVDMEAQDDEVPEMPTEPRAQAGDLYELGSHRVLCGDSTKLEDVERLMDGKKADMVFTDPPYNVDYSGSGKKTKEGILNDKMTDADFNTFLIHAFKRMAEFTKKTAGWYIFHSHKTASDFETALNEVGVQIDTQLIWNKPSAGMGMNDYRTKHEPFFYAYLSKDDKKFYGDRTGTTVWKMPQDDERAFKWFKKQQEHLEHGESSVWTMSRANVNEYVHPTQKPVELPAVAIMKSSKSEDIVLDTFLGSGTTLIAAEKTGRVCYGCELDERYVDVIVQRYVDYVDNPVVKCNGEVITWNKTPTKSPTKD